MSKRKDSDKAATVAAPAPSPAAESAPAAALPQIDLAPADPVKAEAPVVGPPAIESPKLIEMPKPVEAALRAVESLKPVEPIKSLAEPEAAVEPPVASEPIAPPVAPTSESRSNRFALLAASVAFAGAVGALTGALGATMITRSHAPAPAPANVVDLAPVQGAITSLRSDVAAIKSVVDSSGRNTHTQFAKMTERLERIDRAQAAPAAQLKQAVEAIEHLEKRVQSSSHAAAAETTGSVRPQQVAAVPSTPAPMPTPAAASAEPPRPQLLDGWVVRHVSRGVAVIQGRRMGLIEVETGDIVPGVGRIESIRRQDGRWVVVTSKGLIRSAGGPVPPIALPR